MEKTENFCIDNGMREFPISRQGSLRFNPRDINLCHRFLDARTEIGNLVQQMDGKIAALGADADGSAKLTLLNECDRSLKEILNRVFAPGNDFDLLLENVNLMSTANNGKTVLENLLAYLVPIFEQAREENVQVAAELAAARAEQNRREREALA